MHNYVDLFCCLALHAEPNFYLYFILFLVFRKKNKKIAAKRKKNRPKYFTKKVTPVFAVTAMITVVIDHSIFFSLRSHLMNAFTSLGWIGKLRSDQCLLRIGVLSPIFGKLK